ncbi:hypothetical protein HBI40_038960 [Parastagonospora nodorum]|nr:hypothetical protein HBI10_024200 [Parastagonospora nodorum]KAH4022902.1 hypothetical protein HBI13_091820 [Parastagonospora nodorum]KAH4933798.1 hypothetical protein HBH73_181860 [Parastagonospora nodorum]KAH4953143.1 hypothetical protein HBH74_005220 [Parastagonospora nodorum]KAH5387743.1 hypothetical protein HBI33_053030 [Parastagonospora nodorum]
MIRTTLSNMKKHQAGIVWDDLPKTFQHAIDFTHRLGFKYLWIDSLCIIQDSVSDWRLEAGSMAGVYESSSLTLCASLSADSSGGCYTNAEPEHLSRSLILTGSDSKPFRIHTRQPLKHIDFNIHDGATELPLLSRGWALQERLLLPRTLDFTANELIWDCPEIRVCECSAHNGFHRHRIRMDPHLWMGGSVGDICRWWNSVVYVYTRTTLSLPKDIFPALQGIVKKAPPTMGQYLAGLWRETLVVGLNWSAVDPEKHLRPKEWRAPTWSWASVMGPLDTDLVDRKNYSKMPSIEVIEAKTTPKGTDPTGELSSGELLIRGRGVKMQVIHGSGSDGIGSFYGSYGGPSLSLLHENETLECLNGGFRTMWDYAIAAPGPDHVPDGSEVIVVKILEDVREELIVSRSLCHSSWLILQSNKHDPEAFDRIGLGFVVGFGGASDNNFHLHVEKAYGNSPEVEMRII